MKWSTSYTSWHCPMFTGGTRDRKGLWQKQAHLCTHLKYLTSREHVQPPTSTPSFPVLSDDPPCSWSHLWEGHFRQEQPFHDTTRRNRAGATRMCAEERELFYSDLMESGDTEVSNAAPDRFSGGWCLHNSDKGTPGNCKFNLTYSSHVCLRRLGGFELQEEKRKANSLQSLEMSVDWQNETAQETGGSMDNCSQAARAGLARRRKYHFDYVQEDLFMNIGFLAESDWILFRV